MAIDKKDFVRQYILNQSINRRIISAISKQDIRDTSIDMLLDEKNDIPSVKIAEVISEAEKIWDSMTELNYGDVKRSRQLDTLLYDDF